MAEWFEFWPFEWMVVRIYRVRIIRVRVNPVRIIRVCITLVNKGFATEVHFMVL